LINSRGMFDAVDKPSCIHDLFFHIKKITHDTPPFILFRFPGVVCSSWRESLLVECFPYPFPGILHLVCLIVIN
jgi:hypothetical protein